MKSLGIVFLVVMLFCAGISAQTTAFTYQGSMQNSGTPANGNFDFEFKLFDAVSAGVQQGSTLQRLNVAVANGIFTVTLDFGAGTLPGANRFLDIAVRTAGGGAFTALTPRQQVNSAPYSVRSLNATSADSVAVAGLPSGSSNYIQNSLSVQPASQFNVSGTGRANVFIAASHFQLGSNPVLSVNSAINGTYLGVGAAASVPVGVDNSFFGHSAGNANSSGARNSFFGAFAGALNTLGPNNSFFGASAGAANTTGSNNSFFGRSAGAANTTGFSNAFFGSASGTANTSGERNSFFGALSGNANTTGGFNSFFGYEAGQANISGTNNAFFGVQAGFANTAGFNSFFGTFAGQLNTTGNFNSFFGLNAGRANTTGSQNAIFGAESGIATTTGSFNSFFGYLAGKDNTIGKNNSFFGHNAGAASSTGNDNSFFGTGAGITNTTGTGNTFVGYQSGDGNASGSNNSTLGAFADVAPANLDFATAIGAGATVGASNRIQLGRDTLDTVRIGNLGAASAINLCITANNVLAACSSSGRYKKNIKTLGGGLNLVQGLRPVTFDWNDRSENDLGLIAEEVAEADPLLVTHDRNGAIQGVKYDQISVIAVNAIKEQQAQIENQQRENLELKKQVEALKAVVCSIKADADVCKTSQDRK